MWLPIIVVLIVTFVMWVGSASGIHDKDENEK
jgi:hypothetical protein